MKGAMSGQPVRPESMEDLTASVIMFGAALGVAAMVILKIRKKISD